MLILALMVTIAGCKNVAPSEPVEEPVDEVIEEAILPIPEGHIRVHYKRVNWRL